VRVEASEYVYYVVRRPLARDEAALLAIGVVPGTTIGLGVETPRLARPAGYPPPGGRGGPGGPGDLDGDPPEGAEPPRSVRFIPPEPIRYWAVLELASPQYDESGEPGSP
jgi:hypothetical protein